MKWGLNSIFKPTDDSNRNDIVIFDLLGETFYPVGKTNSDQYMSIETEDILWCLLWISTLWISKNTPAESSVYKIQILLNKILAGKNTNGINLFTITLNLIKSNPQSYGFTTKLSNICRTRQGQILKLLRPAAVSVVAYTGTFLASLSGVALLYLYYCYWGLEPEMRRNCIQFLVMGGSIDATKTIKEKNPKESNCKCVCQL